MFNSLTQEFNSYAEENSLDYEVAFTSYTIYNCSMVTDNYGSIVDHLLKKGKTDFDVIIYDNMYSPRYSPYFEDLRDWIPPEHIAMYSSGAANQTSNNYGFFHLYSNSELLTKYNKPLPKTWDELLETGKYILMKERENGNTDLKGFCNLFKPGEDTMVSFYEYMYSFRKTFDSPFPDYLSEESIRGLETLKKIKDEISSDRLFQMDVVELIIQMAINEGIFIKNWYYTGIGDVWNKTILVGGTPGISGSSIGLFNMGISKYIPDERKKGAAEVIKFMTGKEMQKKYVIMKYGSYSGIQDLYDDPEVCSIIDCDIAKSVQPITRPSALTDNYDEYSSHVGKYLNEYLYGDTDISAKDTLIKINDIIKIYTIEIDYKSSLEGFLSLIFKNKVNESFNFFTKDLWILIFIGILINLNSVLTEYGELTNFKCQLKVVLFEFGFSFTFIPILYNLILNLPINIKNINWIKNNKYKYFSLFFIFDVILTILILCGSAFEIKEYIFYDGKNFNRCHIGNELGLISLILTIIKFILDKLKSNEDPIIKKVLNGENLKINSYTSNNSRISQISSTEKQSIVSKMISFHISPDEYITRESNITVCVNTEMNEYMLLNLGIKNVILIKISVWKKEEVQDVMLSTSNYKTSGPDGINCIKLLFNRIKSGEFPNSWNQANIVSIPPKRRFYLD
ncbi:hypothetical protein PIROE2DRAFT_3409 [Piromyces sp. E2]|nr:hypothetical protein PIROE2DRAFT_3409 [Piromyces sp. E2]|eukprot:OUM68879.1 hypothetical protein PIROE2DRAFT_3409 [Piromyces sp. E2]